jgi:hypothetical protein
MELVLHRLMIPQYKMVNNKIMKFNMKKYCKNIGGKMGILNH